MAVNAGIRCNGAETLRYARAPMRAKPLVKPVEDDLFRQELVNIINMRHELVRLAELIDWLVFDREFGAQFVSTTGRPALPARLVAGLLYLKHAYALNDEEVIERWVENPYFQHFCGERYFQHEVPCDPSGRAGAMAARGDGRCGHNLRMILARLRALYCALIAWVAIRSSASESHRRAQFMGTT